MVQTDALEVGLRDVLSQEVDGEEHPILYIRQKLFPQECNYSVIEKDALTIKWAIDALRYYLLGAPFVLITYQGPLKWLHTMKDTNARLMRWYLTLQPYAYTIRHRTGKDNANMDFLSLLWGSRDTSLKTGSCT